MKLSNEKLTKIGKIIIDIIVQRTLKGLDKDGKPFKPYSTRWFAMPSGAIPKRAQKILVRDKKLIYIERKDKETWALIHGYLSLKKAIFKKTDYDGKVNLSLTGKMLGAITVLKVGNNRITIGFTRSEEGKKAAYNINRGRDFWGFKPQELGINDLTNL